MCTALCAALAACSAASAPQIALDSTDPKHPAVVVTGLSRRDLRAIDSVALPGQVWPALLRVSVIIDGKPMATPVAGRYNLSSREMRFTPGLPFEPGRSFAVIFDPHAVPGGALAGVPQASLVIAMPGRAASPRVHVTAVYPTGPVVPANLLRMYIEFSGPMGTRTGQDYVRVVDAEGNDISGALLPLDTDLWNGDHTRFTVLFDPGRVKRGILPNRAMGRPLKAGSTFAIVVSGGWPDAESQPLASDFRKEYRVGPPIERGLSLASWHVQPPAAASRDSLRVTFPTPLDRGLLQRALSVIRVDQGADRPVTGEIRVDDGETGWSFVPGEPWPSGDYVISVLPALEDPSGNRIGHPFETRSGDDDTGRPPARIPFRIH